MPWVGGKSVTRKDGNGAWIASLLPPVQSGQTYIEPFAGMLGVLLQRAPSANEIVNDADKRVLNWWRVVRDQPEELARSLELTPNSRIEHAEAAAANQCEGVEGARAFTIAALQSFGRGATGKNDTRSWLRRQDGRNEQRTWHAGLPSRIPALAERIKAVYLEHGDAVPLVAELGALPHAILYCDPPYGGVGSGYIHDVDRHALFEALLGAKARVAISGYGEEWDGLLAEGWRKHTRTAIPLRQKQMRRVEAVWTNYDGGQAALL